MDDFIKPQKQKPEPAEPKEPTKPEPANLAAQEDALLDKVSTTEPGPEPELSSESEELIVDTPKEKSGRRNPKQWFLDLSKKQKILFCLAMVVLLAGAGFAIYKLTRPKPAEVARQAEAKKQAAKPKTEASRLTGVQVKPELNKRGVTGVMIENSEVARPQAGLKEAGVVFEAIAEGGITRFLALYQEGQPESIGPVRSVRPYYLDWLQGFDAPIAHAGGSVEGLAKIKSDRVRDLDQFANAGAYQRVTNREAPHNLFTSATKLDDLKTSKGFSVSTFDGFARKKEKALATPTAKAIDLKISSGAFNVHYDYDLATNTYKRSEGGTTHSDQTSGSQLAPKVVIANVFSYSVNSGGGSSYSTIGSGKAFIFQDGGVTEGTWNKASSTEQIIFKDARGEVIKLNPGQTWITALSNAASATFTP